MFGRLPDVFPVVQQGTLQFINSSLSPCAYFWMISLAVFEFTVSSAVSNLPLIPPSFSSLCFIWVSYIKFCFSHVCVFLYVLKLIYKFLIAALRSFYYNSIATVISVFVSIDFFLDYCSYYSVFAYLNTFF